MNPPGVALSVGVVVMAWLISPTARHRRRADEQRPSWERFSPFAAVLVAALVWGALAVMADPLAGSLSVTPPTVRVAAGVSLLIVSVGRAWSWARCAAPTPGEGGVTNPPATAIELPVGTALGMIEALVRGPVRVEVGMAVWSLSLDHGTAIAVVTIGVLAALAGGSVLAGRPEGSRGSGPQQRATIPRRREVVLGAAGSGVAVLLALNGVLGL